MKTIKKIYKYPTGAEIPEGAVYLSTVTQTEIYDQYAPNKDVNGGYVKCWYVWHYFLVETEN